MRTELRKLKRKKVPLLILGLCLVEALWYLFVMRGDKTVHRSLAQAPAMFCMLMGLIAGLLAVQIVGVDRETGMDDWFGAKGQSAVKRFIKKLVLADVVMIAFHLALIAMVLVMAPVLKLKSDPIVDKLLGPLLLATSCACHAVTAIQFALAVCLKRVSTGVVLGLVADLLAMGLPFANAQHFGWLIPWGVLAAANPAKPVMINKGLSVSLIANIPLAMVGAVIAAVFWTLISVLIIKRKEDRR